MKRSLLISIVALASIGCSSTPSVPAQLPLKCEAPPPMPEFVMETDASADQLRRMMDILESYTQHLENLAETLKDSGSQ